MFVCTVKSSKIKTVLLIVLTAVAVGSLLWFSMNGKPAANDGAITLKAENEEQRLAFISQFGWEVHKDPIEVAEIILPTQFDEVFEKYNEIQKEQNLDLSLYSGKRVKRWTYAVINYPGYENKQDVIQLSLLIYDGTVIGGDVSSTELNGFMHGFDLPETQSATQSSNGLQ
ncbi:MAG: DUF4830 domain-containing protein [Clostridia bacterium]|nr:DUF4830 domain-containing protein [Clostridia bacterium]MBQ6697638.1 DUF4830 domain-containing protein [Oscillospiraceae bacterium]MBQ7054886.1 DUF4830 domain-containing protein [Oscillospiraceae bacterium]